MSNRTLQPAVQSPTEVLVRCLQQGSNDLDWAKFARRFESTIDAVCLRNRLNANDSEDIRQEVLIALRQLIHKFTFIHEKRGFRAWLSAIVENHVRRHRQHQTAQWLVGRGGTSGLLRMSQISRESRTWIVPELLKSDRLILRQYECLKIAIDNCRQRCDPTTHEAFEQRYVQGKSPREIADALGLNPESVQRMTLRHRERIIREARRLGYQSCDGR